MPELVDKTKFSETLGQLVWKYFAARAATAGVALLTYQTVCWKKGPIPKQSFEPPIYGTAPGLPAARDDACVLMMHSGVMDRIAARRFYLPCPPRGWSAGGLLTADGMAACEAVAQIGMMGFGGHLLPHKMAGLIAYHGEQPPTFENPSGTVFRTLQYIAACQHTDRQPDVRGTPWP